MKVKTLLVVLLLANLTSCNLTSDLSLQSNSQDNIEELIDVKTQIVDTQIELDNHIIASRLTEALKMSIRILQKDHNYAKASYSGKEKCVSWFLPIHMSCDIMQEPELVIAIRRVGAFYEPKTVLPYNDEMKDKFMALSLYREVW